MSIDQNSDLSLAGLAIMQELLIKHVRVLQIRFYETNLFIFGITCLLQTTVIFVGKQEMFVAMF